MRRPDHRHDRPQRPPAEGPDRRRVRRRRPDASDAGRRRSFGFKHGLPLDVDIVIDVRFLPNPHWIEELRPLTGLDAAVAATSSTAPHAGVPRACRRPARACSCRRSRPRARATSLAIGCTGGRHRSVVLAEELAPPAAARGFDVRTDHRDSAALILHRSSVPRSADAARRQQPRLRPSGVKGTPRMTVRVGINGFGRIGRNFFRAAKKRRRRHRLRRRQRPRVARDDGPPAEVRLVLGRCRTRSRRRRTASRRRRRLKVLSDARPGELPWGDLGVDVVVESTGFFTDATRRPRTSTPAPARGRVGPGERRRRHVRRRASTTPTSTPKPHKVISNACCTTNCFVPMVKVLDDAFGVEQGLMTTVHAYTGDQQLVDGPHSDLRRARAAAINIVPTAPAPPGPPPRARVDEGQARRHLAAGAGPDRLDHRLHRGARRRGHRSTRSTPLQEGRQARPAEGRHRYCEEPIVSSDIAATRTPASSTPG